MSFLGTLINGKRFDHSSHEISFDGIPNQNISEISYSETLEPGEQRGTAAGKLGRTRGVYNAEGSVTMYVEDWEALASILVAKGLGGYMEAEFVVTVTMFELTGVPVVHTLRGCRVTSVEDSSSAGSDVREVTIQLDIMQILRGANSAVSPRGL